MLNAANEPSAPVIGPVPLITSLAARQRLPGFVTVHNPFKLASLDVHQKTMHRDFRADERAVPDNVASLDDVLPFAAEHAEKFVEVFRQQMPLDAQGLQFVKQLHRRGFGNLAVRVADDGDFLAALDGAGQRQRPHGAGERPGDDVARVPQPDELFGGQRERVRENRIQPRINARERNDRQLSLEIRRMQTGRRVTLHRPVVRINDGFEEVHESREPIINVFRPTHIQFVGFIIGCRMSRLPFDFECCFTMR